MGDEAGFSEKWEFRRQENNFDDSSSDDPDSSSTHDPVIHNPTPVLDSSQLDNGTTTVTREQPVKTRKRRTKKDESKPQKAKQVRRRKPKIVCAEKNEETVMEDKKKEETVLEDKEKDETAMETDDVGMFMKTLLDDLTASRESLMVWMSTELYGSSDQNVASRPSPKKRAVAAVAAQRSVKKRRTKKKREEEEKESERQSKQDEMSKLKEKSLDIAQNGGEQVQELDYSAGSLDMFLNSSQGGLGRNYFQQQEQVQERTVAKTEMDNEKNATVTNQKSVVLAIKAPKLIQRQKKTTEANTIMNRSSMVERTVSETQKDDDSFAIPFAPKLSSSSPSLQSFPVGYNSSLNSLFPSSSQGVTSLASNDNKNFQPPVVSQIPDLSEFQTGFIGGQGFGNSLFHNNGYISDLPTAFQPNLIAGSYNLPAQVNPATTSSQQSDNNNMFGGPRVSGGAIRYFGNRFPDSDVGNGNNSFSDYKTGSGR